MENWKKYLAAILLACAALYTSYWYGKQSNPPETIVKIEEKIVEKIVTLEVEKKKEKKDTVTVITTNPDGSSTTTITERSETNTDTTTKTDEQRESEKNNEIVSKSNKLSKYRVGASVDSKVLDKEKRGEWLYSANASMRVFGPWWLDGRVGVSEKTLGLGVSVEF